MLMINNVCSYQEMMIIEPNEQKHWFRVSQPIRYNMFRIRGLALCVGPFPDLTLKLANSHRIRKRLNGSADPVTTESYADCIGHLITFTNQFKNQRISLHSPHSQQDRRFKERISNISWQFAE